MSWSKFLAAPMFAWALMMGAAGLQATPPTQGLGRNSLGVNSSGGARYRPQRPTISPYLALAPQGVGQLGSINYYILVRPQFAQQQVNQQQGAELNRLESRVTSDEQEIAAEAAGKNPQTGNHAAFMTHQRYFGVRHNIGVQGSNKIPGAALRNQQK